MIIVFGTRCFGRADVIEGLGHVTCKFFHISFVPLVPIETLFMLGPNRGAKLPFSFKAAMSGWLRAGAILSGIGFALGGLPIFAGGEVLVGGVMFVLAALCFGAFPLFGKLFGGCSEARRAEILSHLGMGPGRFASRPPAHAPPAPFGPPLMPAPMPAPWGPPPAGGFGHPSYPPAQGYGAPPPAPYGAPPPAPYGAAPQQPYPAQPQQPYPAPPPAPYGGSYPPRR